MEMSGGGSRKGVERRCSIRRQHRRTHSYCSSDDHHPAKRLFTPEIKRFLKGWLVRRRDNPYPNRDEKKALAIKTGLTYVQVCNWFANWRRKLKNAGGEPQRTTWSHLIKAYNSQAQGNVEHFSICSDDSIWEERGTTSVDHCYTSVDSKYKTHIMERYLNDLDAETRQAKSYLNNLKAETRQDGRYLNDLNVETRQDKSYPNVLDVETRHAKNYLDAEKRQAVNRPGVLTKWLQSAANFRPRRENYAGWEHQRQIFVKRKKELNGQQHGREELDAAEALTSLACVSAQAS